MPEWLTNAFKGVVGLFKGKGQRTTNLGYGNKSITTGDNSGTIGNIMVADNIHLAPPPVPQNPPFVTVLATFEVRPAIGQYKFMTENHPARGSASYLRVTINNPTDKAIFVLSFELEMTDGKLLKLDPDSKTQEKQSKREVRPGDTLSFHIEGSVLKQFKPEFFDFEFAVVTTALGDKYKSPEGELQGCIRQVLELTE